MLRDTPRYFTELECCQVYSDTIYSEARETVLAMREIWANEIASFDGELKTIVHSGVGYDSIYVDTARGIAVCNNPGVTHHAVAEMAAGASAAGLLSGRSAVHLSLIRPSVA